MLESPGGPSLSREINKGLLDYAALNAFRIREKMSSIACRTNDKHERSRQIESLPGFLGKGEHGFAFFFNWEGEGYVIKMHPENTMILEASALEKAMGISHIPKFIDYIPETGALVMTLVPGTPMDCVSVDRYEPSKIAMGQLANTIVALNERGLGVDPRPANFLFDSNVGIAVVDVRESRSKIFGVHDQLYHASACLINLAKLLHPEIPVDYLKREVFIRWLKSIQKAKPQTFLELKERILTRQISRPAMVRIYGLDVSPDIAIEVVSLV